MRRRSSMDPEARLVSVASRRENMPSAELEGSGAMKRMCFAVWRLGVAR